MIYVETTTCEVGIVNSSEDWILGGRLFSNGVGLLVGLQRIPQSAVLVQTERGAGLPNVGEV